MKGPHERRLCLSQHKAECLKWSWSSELLVGWLNEWNQNSGVKEGSIWKRKTTARKVKGKEERRKIQMAEEGIRFHSLIPSAGFLSTYYAPATWLGTRDMAADRRDSVVIMKPTFYWKR